MSNVQDRDGREDLNISWIPKPKGLTVFRTQGPWAVVILGTTEWSRVSKYHRSCWLRYLSHLECVASLATVHIKTLQNDAQVHDEAK